METGGTCFKLDADISVSTRVGMSGRPFAGVFDGGGHTLTVDLDSSEQYCAPFGCVSGATIENLTVGGEIRGGQYSSGLVGYQSGTVTIENVVVAADIINHKNYCGGYKQ